MFRVLNLRKLGSGGFAEIFLGQRSDTGESVVVKYLRNPENPANRRTFCREIRILSRKLNGLVPILSYTDEGARPYYVMPYFEQGCIERFAGKLNHEQLRAVAEQLANGIAEMHRNDIAHGDLKPANILITDHGSIRVGDPMGNGDGCTISYDTNCGGTPGYWAPEVARGQPISKAADVYSFGATLFHLATGRAPRDEEYMDVGAAAPKDLRTIITRCCQHSPPARPSCSTIQFWLRNGIDTQKNKKDPLVTLAATFLGVAAVVLIAVGIAKVARG